MTDKTSESTESVESGESAESTKSGEPGGVQRIRLEGISSRAFEHPADKAALTAMRRVPGFQPVVRKFVGLVGERRLRYLFLGSAVRVSDRQFKDLNRIYEECLETLDFSSRPELFVAQRPIVNAGAIGVDEPFVVLTSLTLELMTEDELRVIIGHELGHILSGHVLYKTMMRLLIRFSQVRLGIPLTGLALQAIIAALGEWNRKSELSCDRAGVLTCQDPTVSYTVLMKLAGGMKTSQMSLDEFVLQAEEYRTSGHEFDSILKLLNLVGQSHPFHVLRLWELKRWVEEGEYEAVLGGDYERREQEGDASVREDVADSARSYREAVADSTEPIVKAIRDLGTSVSETSSRLFGSIKDKFRKNRGEGEEGADGAQDDIDPAVDIDPDELDDDFTTGE